MNKDMELSLEIDDDFKSVQFFDVNIDYPDTYDDLTNEIRVSVSDKDETIAYLECIVFNDGRIAESDYDYIYLADSMTQDSYEAMVLLQERSLVPPTAENQTLGELLTNHPTVTVYLHYMAVKDSYRKKGIGGWLLRNLSRILKRNYSIFPRLIITLISPQEINWVSPMRLPIFSNLDEESAAYKEMYEIMKQLFEKNGYEQHGNTKYYIAHRNNI